MHRILTLICILALAGSLLAGAALVTQSERLARGRGPALPPPSLDARPDNLFGVNVALLGADPDERDAALDTIARAGFGWVRQVFDWQLLQPAADTFDWSAADVLVQAATARNLRLIAVLHNSPAWARAPQTPAAAPPDDPATFANFAAAFAARYGDRVDVYQIWDEPNLRSGWGDQLPNPAAYARLLAAAYSAIHTADPAATVLLAGLAPTTETGPDNVSELLYLRQLYEQGAAEYFDAAAAKPYGFAVHPADRDVNPEVLNFSRFILLREEMTRAGDADSLLWASNFGWNHLPDGWTGEPSLWDYVSIEEQALRTQAAYERARLEWPWAGVLVLENFQPDAPPGDARWGFALVDQEGQPSATLDLLADYLPTASSAAPPGVHRADNPYAQYTGDWEFSELGADIPQSGRADVEFTFEGADLGLVVRRDNYRAYLYVEVDGQPANALPRDANGAAYALLTSGDYQPHTETIWLARNLVPGQHTAHIRADRGWDQWAIVGFAVGAAAGRPGLPWALAGLTLLALLSAAGVWRFGRETDWVRPLRKLFTRLGGSGQMALTAIMAALVWASAWLTWGTDLAQALRRYGDSLPLFVTAATAGVFYFSPWLLLTLLSMAALFVTLTLRPEFTLPLIAFFAPFYLLPRPLFERVFSLVEVTALMGAGVLALHLIARWRAKRQQSAPLLPLVLRAASRGKAVGYKPVLSHRPEPVEGEAEGSTASNVSKPSAFIRSFGFAQDKVHPRPIFTQLDWAVVAFTTLSLLSIFFAANRGVAFTEFRTMVVEPAIVYALIRLLPLRERDVWRTVDFWVLGAALVAVIGLYQYATGTNLITAEGGVARLRSVYGSPNNVGLYLGRVLPVAVAVVVMGRSSHPLRSLRRPFGSAQGRPRRNSEPSAHQRPASHEMPSGAERTPTGSSWRRWLYLVAALVMAPALVLSFSRGALLIGVPAALAVIALFWQGRRAALALGGLAAAGLAALIPLSRHPRFAELLNLSTGPTFFRLNLWRSTLSMIRDHPLAGVGLDNFLYAYRGRYILPAAWQDPNLSHAHNWLLDYAARLGLPGLAAALWLLAVFLRLAYRATRRLSDPNLRALAVGLFASMVDFLAHGLVDASYWFIDLAFVFMLTVGLVGWLAGRGEDNTGTGRKSAI